MPSTLDRIAALCDRHAPAPAGACQVADEVRAILAEVSPREPGGVLDRDQARAVLNRYLRLSGRLTEDEALDALAVCVRPAAIDRDALLVLLAEFGYDGAEDRTKLANAVLALVRPAAIDRRRLNAILDELPIEDEAIVPLADAILALVRPMAVGS